MEEEIIAWQHNIFLLKLNLPKFKQKLKSARGGLQMTIWSIQLTQRAVLTKKRRNLCKLLCSTSPMTFSLASDLLLYSILTPLDLCLTQWTTMPKFAPRNSMLSSVMWLWLGSSQSFQTCPSLLCLERPPRLLWGTAGVYLMFHLICLLHTNSGGNNVHIILIFQSKWMSCSCTCWYQWCAILLYVLS